MILLKAFVAASAVQAKSTNKTKAAVEDKQQLDDMYEHMKRNPLVNDEMLGTHEDIDELSGGLAWNKMIPKISTKLGEIEQ